MKHLSTQVGKISQNKDKERLDDLDMAGMFSDESTNQAVDDSDKCPTKCYDEEGSNPRDVVDDLDVGLPDLCVALHHVVHHLQHQTSYHGYKDE